MSEPKDYCFCSDWDGDGEIYNRDNKIIWKFQSTALKESPDKSGVFQLPVFSFRDAEGKELLAIYREKRFPMAQFNIIESGLTVCTISQRSLFFTKYEFNFHGGLKWNLHLPMFSVFGKSVSESGGEILVRIHTRRQWFVRAEFDNPPMMAALAYIIRKKVQRT